LADETHPSGEREKVMAIKVSEESEDVFICVEIRHFANNFHSKDIAPHHLGCRAPSSQSSFGKALFHKIISFAEDIYDRIIKVHCLALHDQRNNVCF